MNTLRRLLIILVKYVPIVQMIGMLINNLLYFSDIYFASYILSYLIGGSIINTAILLVCSYLLYFCKWHRLIIIANFINCTIATIDSIYKIPVGDLQLLIIYHFVAAVFVITATIIHIKNKHECENKVT